MKKIIALSLLSSSALTPLLSLTSCGTNYVEPITMYNMLDESTWPEVEPIHVSGIKTQEEISDLYIQSIESDKSIFIKDMVRGASGYVEVFKHMFEEDGIDLTQFELGFSMPTFGTAPITHVGDVDETVNTISCRQRIHITYEMGQPTDAIHYIENINVEIVYKNVIFVGYENTMRQESTEHSPWCISVLDNNIGDESFWYYQFDASPWSISYSCTNEKTKIIKGGEGRPDVVINDTEYYSGVFDDVYKLHNAYIYIGQDPQSVYDEINQRFLKMVLLIDYESKLLSKVNREVDMRCWSPLVSSVYAVEEVPIDIEISGLAFFPPTQDSIERATVKLNADITLVEDTEMQPRDTIELSNDEHEVNLSSDFKHMYKMPATYHPDGSSKRATKTFIIPVNSLTFEVKCYNSQETITIPVVVNLHYTTLTLNFVA